MIGRVHIHYREAVIPGEKRGQRWALGEVLVDSVIILPKCYWK